MEGASDNLVAIISGTVGVVTVVVIIVVIVIFCLRRRNHDSQISVGVKGSQGSGVEVDNYAFDATLQKRNSQFNKVNNDCLIYQISDSQLQYPIKPQSHQYQHQTSSPLYSPDLFVPDRTFDHLKRNSDCNIQLHDPIVQNRTSNYFSSAHIDHIALDNENGKVTYNKVVAGLPQAKSLQNLPASSTLPHAVSPTRLLVNHGGLPPGYDDVRSFSLSNVHNSHSHLQAKGLTTYGHIGMSTASSLGQDSGIESMDNISHTDNSSLSSADILNDTGERTPDSPMDNINISQVNKWRRFPGPAQTRSMVPQQTIREISHEDSYNDADISRSPSICDSDCSPLIESSPKDTLLKLIDCFQSLDRVKSPESDIPLVSQNFAAGYYNETGGLLQLKDGSASVNIPRNALQSKELIYIYSYFENEYVSGQRYLRRVVECGREGLQFNQPVCVAFTPYLVNCSDRNNYHRKFDNLEVITSSMSDEEWSPLLANEAFWDVPRDMKIVTIHVMHFTRFTITPAINDQRKCEVHLQTGETKPSSQKYADPINHTDPINLFVYAFQNFQLKQNGLKLSMTRIFITDCKKDLTEKLSTKNKPYTCSLPAPKSLKLRHNLGDIELGVVRCDDCENMDDMTQLMPLSTFYDEPKDEDGNTEYCEFRVKSTCPHSDASFGIAIDQRNQVGHSLVIYFSIPHSSNNGLNYEDIICFLNDNKFEPYPCNNLISKALKLKICSCVESSANFYIRIAEHDYVGLDSVKIKWLKNYAHDKAVTPCYMVLDLIEARFIQSKMQQEDAHQNLYDILNDCGLEYAADQVKVSHPQYFTRTAPKGRQHVLPGLPELSISDDMKISERTSESSASSVISNSSPPFSRMNSSRRRNLDDSGVESDTGSHRTLTAMGSPC